MLNRSYVISLAVVVACQAPDVTFTRAPVDSGASSEATPGVCGDGVIQPPEQCDDANTVDGDGCSHQCTMEVCGNGTKDFGEACDDGNTVAGDGCSANCKSTEICGNGIVDTQVGELCDDGNTSSGDGCNADCRYGEGCGNGIIDIDMLGNPLEECDDGNLDNNDDCRYDCVVNRCGDGVANFDGSHREECDDAPPQSSGSRVVDPTETAGCNLDCTLARCGDGKVNQHFIAPGAVGTEQCDRGQANADNTDCTATCRINVCGDGHVDTIGPEHIEQCDDGNITNGDGCDNTCKYSP